MSVLPPPATTLPRPAGGADAPPTALHFVPLDRAHLQELAGASGPCFTFFVTPGTLGPHGLANAGGLLELLSVARHAAITAGHPEELVDRVLAPVVALAADMRGWTSTHPNLVLCVAPGLARGFTLQHRIAPHVAVGDVFRLHPMIATKAFRSSTQILREKVDSRTMSMVMKSTSVTTAPAEVEQAAQEGRVRTLYVGTAMPSHRRDVAEKPSLVDRAITYALRHGGRVRFTPVGLGTYALAASVTASRSGPAAA